MKKFIKKFDSLFLNEILTKTYRKIYGRKKTRIFFRNNFPKLRFYLFCTYWNSFFTHIIKNKLKGDIVECGVGNGATLSVILFNLIYFEKYFLDKKKYFGFDSFQGFPEPSKFDQSIRKPKKGEWDHTSISFIENNLIESGFKIGDIKKFINFNCGFFDQTFKNFESDSIALLHIDCDLYESTKLSLEKFYPKVVSNGLIVFDEYLDAKEHWPGAVKAIDDFFGLESKNIQFDEITRKCFYIKK